MLQIKLTLNNTGNGQAHNLNNLPTTSDDEILQALSYMCKVQSSLSRDKIINLWEIVRRITDCLVNYDIEDDGSLPQPPAGKLCYTGGTNASPSTPRYINPSLITLNKDARDHSGTTSYPTPDSDRFHNPARSSTRDRRSESPSSPFNEDAQGHGAPSAVNKHKLPQVEESYVIPTTHDSSRFDENEFDAALREIDAMESSCHLPHVRPGSSDRTNDLKTSIRPSGNETHKRTENEDLNENDSPSSQPRTQFYGCSRVEGRNFQGRSHEASDEAETPNIEENANRNSSETTAPYDTQAPTPETFKEGTRSGPRASYSTTEKTQLSTTTLVPAERRMDAAGETSDRNYFTGQTSSNCQTTQLPKHQPTIEDDTGETLHSEAEDSFANDDDFGDSDVEAVLEGAHRFLDTSAEHESLFSGAANTEMASNAPVPASCTPNDDDQHMPPAKANIIAPQDLLKKDGLELRRKRRLSSTADLQSPLPSKNLRTRLYKNEGQKASSDPNIDDDRWRGRFSHDSLLSTLLPDQKDEIERKSNRALRSDLPEFLEKHTKLWKSTGFWSSPLLDPSKFLRMTDGRKGHEIWRYVETMETEDQIHYLKARLADVMLYLEYVREFDKQKTAGHPGQTAKIRATNIICGTGSLPKPKADKTRMSFHEHKVVGERWWWSASYLGHGFILLCSEETGKKIRSKSFKLDAFILYNLYNCKSTTACCSKFDAVVDGLLTDGQFSKQVTKKEVQQWIKDANASNRESVPTIDWQAWSTNRVASKASIFLSARACK